MKRLFAYGYILLALTLTMLTLTSGNGATAQQVRDHRVRSEIYRELLDLLKKGSWEKAKDYSWRLMLQLGDRDRDGILNYPENDSFPCNDLRELMELWGQYFGTIKGFDDILLPRFNNRTDSCNISPQIVSFRVSPEKVRAGDSIKFYWEIKYAENVKLYAGHHELEPRIQFANGEFGWPLSMPGALQMTENKSTTYKLVAGSRGGQTTTKTFTVRVVEVRDHRTR
jgi:hypothetical protein